MTPQTPESTPAAHVARAKAEQAAGDLTAARTHALIAIAELMLTILPTVQQTWAERIRVGLGGDR